MPREGGRCIICGAPMEGKRTHAKVCGGACRADLSRVRRILAGQEADGARSLVELLERRRKRTAAGLHG